jgi:chromosome segregation ATPase
MTALRERVRTLSQQLAEASSAARDANETLDASIRQVKQLQNEIVSKDRKLEKLRASESQLDAQLKQSQRQAAEQQSALADLQRQLTNSESERRALRVELTDARSAVLASSSGVSAALEAALARADAAEAAREAALSEARSATIAATRAADDNRALSQQVEATLASSQLTLDASERRASKYAEQLRAALGDLEQLRAEHEQYKSEARRVLASASEASSGDGMAAAAAAASDSSALVLAAANARVSALERELTLARQTTRDVERARDAERANAATTLADAHNAAAAAELEVRTLRAALAADSEAAAARITALQVGRCCARCTLTCFVQNEVDTLAHKYALAQVRCGVLRVLTLHVLCVCAARQRGTARAASDDGVDGERRR